MKTIYRGYKEKITQFKFGVETRILITTIILVNIVMYLFFENLRYDDQAGENDGLLVILVFMIRYMFILRQFHNRGDKDRGLNVSKKNDLWSIETITSLSIGELFIGPLALFVHKTSSFSKTTSKK